MKINVLAENTAKNNEFESEHGLSLYIETGSLKILFDMGQSDMFLRNAEILGIDIAKVDIAVLSHGHYDHAGGLEAFLNINKTAPVYLSRFAFEPHYNGTEKYIGMNLKLMNNPRLIFTEDFTEIAEGITLHSCNNAEQKFDLGSFGLYEKKGDSFIPDDFRHEQYLLIEEDGKRILISGCSHKGILNIVNWFDADALAGGFHFSKLPLDDTLRGYAEYLDSFPACYFTCHCTGTEQYEFMKRYMKNLSYISTGDSIII